MTAVTLSLLGKPKGNKVIFLVSHETKKKGDDLLHKLCVFAKKWYGLKNDGHCRKLAFFIDFPTIS